MVRFVQEIIWPFSVGEGVFVLLVLGLTRSSRTMRRVSRTRKINRVRAEGGLSKRTILGCSKPELG
jgi:hypothetical protein